MFLSERDDTQGRRKKYKNHTDDKTSMKTNLKTILSIKKIGLHLEVAICY